MKKIFKNLGGALMLAAALVFTSCDEFKSFIDNPVSSYLEVNPESVTLKVGEEKALEVTTISDQPITYTSSNKDVATVDEKGVITAVSEGDAIITVSVASTATYAAGMKQVQVKVVPAIDPILTTPLTIEAKAENGAKVKLRKSPSLELKTIKYKKSTDTSWKDYDEFNGWEGAEISLNKGESVSFWSNNAALGQKPDGGWPLYSYFSISDECYVYGNVMSMIDDQEGATAENPKFSTDEVIGASYAFYNLFQYCSTIFNHESKELVLPATTLASYCYYGMFNSCSNLTKAPELKAEKLEDYCYQRMFSFCKLLTKAPELKAETLTPGCYGSMFSGCSSLTKAPDLKAKTLAPYCYSSMFNGCTSLTKAPEIAAETAAPYCCQTMFAWCSSLTKAPVLKAKKLEAGCYNAMFMGCYKLGSLTCLATDITADYCVAAWLNSAGTQVEGDKILYVDKSMTGAGWNPGGGWKVTAVSANN